MRDPKPGDVVFLHGGRTSYEVKSVVAPTDDAPDGWVVVARQGKAEEKSVEIGVNGLIWADVVGMAATVQKGVIK